MSNLALIDTDDQMLRDMHDAELLEIGFERQTFERSLHSYIKAAWPLVEPTMPFLDNWHIHTLADILQSCQQNHGQRWIINIPPGTMKSLLTNVFFPSWLWTRRPFKRILSASYGQHLSLRDNLRTRQIVESPWFQARWPLKLLEDQNTKTRFNTSEHGWRVATSIGGMGTGEHPDYIIIDDPLTAEQAESAQERENARMWYDRTISTRLGRNPAIFIIMQRLHMDDLSGYLLERGGFNHLCLPMEYEPIHANRFDPRTENGELLFKDLFPREKVERMKATLGSYGTAGQFQQRPAPEGGGLFKRSWFNIVDVTPVKAQRVRGHDTASTEGAGDYTASARMALAENIFYIEDIVRGQWSPADVDKVILATAIMDGKDVAQREEQEGGASGKSVIAARTRMLVGYDHKGVSIGGSKITRSKPFRAQCEAGNVKLKRGAWNEAYLAELCDFPTGKHDDQVDASSCAFNAIVQEQPSRKVDLTWGRN